LFPIWSATLVTLSDNAESNAADIIVVGAGLAGATAAAVLGQQGRRVILIDPKERCPHIFKAEKIEPDQAQLLRKFGLLDCLLPHAGRIRHINSYYNGRLFDFTAIEQYGIYYADMVNSLRSHLPATVEFKLGRVTQITNSADFQRVKLAGGEEIGARLLVLACPLSSEMREGLRLKKVVIQKEQSLSAAFTIAPSNRPQFPFDAATCHSTNRTSRVDYLSLFLVRDSMRANLFTFQAAGDRWIRRFIHEPAQTLERHLPKLRNAIGDFRVISRVETGRVDLYRLEGDPQPGVAMIGDTSQNVCPSTGMGLSKIFTDVDVLCAECVPSWFRTPGMGRDKLMQYYDHPRKQAIDAKSRQDASYRRQACTERSFRWRLHRLRLHLSMRFQRPATRVSDNA
jgi:2-polyprenyl-6-methoxyphenol hydroxylase-like FAD-dependent oxidoreductase